MPNVGDSIQSENGRWSFSGDVASNFDAHVERSVPLYHQGHDLAARISDFFLSDGMLVYDLGCSTGELTCLIAERNTGKNINIIGVDCEQDMVDVASKKCAPYPNISIVHDDLTKIELEPTDLVICYYTMQFVRPRARQQVFDRIYEALNWGGGFVMFEKVRAPDARFQDMMTALYTEYKLEHGFSEAEIIQKMRSLKSVLEPFSTSGNQELMRRAGFVDYMTILKYVSFQGFLAIK